MRYLLIALVFASSAASGACRYVWVDHDHRISTPAVKKQVCDNRFDLPTFDRPSIRPIQRPQIKPIERPGIRPFGTQRCRTQSVYEFGRWVDKRICR